MITIRDAEASDCHKLAALARKTYSDAYSVDISRQQLHTHLETKLSDQCIARMLDQDHFFVAEIERELVGYFQVGKVDNDYQSHIDDIPIGVDDLEIRRAYVLSRFQSLKLGTQLMNIVLTDSRVNANVFLTVWGENYLAQKFYRTFDFETIGEFPEYGDDGKLFGFEKIMLRKHR